ncbi:MAG: 3-deoxy-7-phosphoheptulonate synthase [Clostridia bacterium]|nr:3-deoxy-7-phosphoheptulonate synthase [Clostridia bacterium]
MVVVLKSNPDEEQLSTLISWIESKNVTVTKFEGSEKTILGLIGDTSSIDADVIKALNIVEAVRHIQEPYKQVNRKFHPENTVVKIGNVSIGDGSLCIVAGPSAVESEEQITDLALSLKASGAGILRGGTFMPRTSPYAFQGLGTEAITYLVKAGKAAGLPTVSEIMRISQLDTFADIDVIQVGARNMQNFDLLKELGRSDKPVILSRGISANYKELLMSAEYIVSQGNSNVILCERGIRTFEDHTRNTFDVASIPVLKELSHLPVLADPCHATGRAELISPLSKAATAAGADGLLIQVHTNPTAAVSDQSQQITPMAFKSVAADCNHLHKALNEN